MTWTLSGTAEPAQNGFQQAKTAVWFTQFPSPQTAWNQLSLHCKYQTNQQINLILDPWYLIVDHANQRITLGRYVHCNYVQTWDVFLPTDQPADLHIHCDLTSITIECCGKTLTYTSAQSKRITIASVEFPPNVFFTQPTFQGHTLPEKRVTPTQKSLECTVDFGDDLLFGPYTQTHLDKMFQCMADLHVSKIYWIHHGVQGNGFWESTEIPLLDEYARKTFENLGPDYLTAAVKVSRKLGIPLIATYKPLEHVICHYTHAHQDPATPPEALGGDLAFRFDFGCDHPDICLKRRNPSSFSGTVTAMTIRSRGGGTAIPQTNDLPLYISDDNSTYSLYTGPRRIHFEEKQIRITDLAIQNRFIVVQFPKEVSAHIRHTRDQLITLYDQNNTPITFTYGLFPRRIRKAGFHLDQKIEVLDFKTHGLNFDCAGYGAPSGVFAASYTQMEIYTAANTQNIIGVATATNTHVPGFPCESEPETHRWWMTNINQMLDAGVDGVCIRFQVHANVFDWKEYGFNACIMTEYQKRYGSFQNDEKSFTRLRTLRGEFFTDFLRKASRHVRKKGKEFHLHFEDMHQGPAEEPSPMNLYLPWEKWVEEQLCDGVTLKALNPVAHITAFGRDVIAACQAKNIPVTFTPFTQSLFGHPFEKQLLEGFHTSGLAAFNIYEFASLYIIHQDLRVEEAAPEVISWLKSQQWTK